MAKQVIKQHWIENVDADPVGTVGFLILISPERGADRYVLSDRPAYTNMSHEPRLHGWCGTTDNVARHARGMARIARTAANGRALVRSIHGEELSSALETLGFPELDPA